MKWQSEPILTQCEQRPRVLGSATALCAARCGGRNQALHGGGSGKACGKRLLQRRCGVSYWRHRARFLRHPSPLIILFDFPQDYRSIGWEIWLLILEDMLIQGAQYAYGGGVLQL